MEPSPTKAQNSSFGSWDVNNNSCSRFRQCLTEEGGKSPGKEGGERGRVKNRCSPDGSVAGEEPQRTSCATSFPHKIQVFHDVPFLVLFRHRQLLPDFLRASEIGFRTPDELRFEKFVVTLPRCGTFFFDNARGLPSRTFHKTRQETVKQRKKSNEDTPAPSNCCHQH